MAGHGGMQRRTSEFALRNNHCTQPASFCIQILQVFSLLFHPNQQSEHPLFHSASPKLTIRSSPCPGRFSAPACFWTVPPGADRVPAQTFLTYPRTRRRLLLESKQCPSTVLSHCNWEHAGQALRGTLPDAVSSVIQMQAKIVLLYFRQQCFPLVPQQSTSAGHRQGFNDIWCRAFCAFLIPELIFVRSVLRAHAGVYSKTNTFPEHGSPERLQCWSSH